MSFSAYNNVVAYENMHVCPTTKHNLLEYSIHRPKYLPFLPANKDIFHTF